MAKKLVIISSSLRPSSNSELLARKVEEGAKEAGCETEFITLKDKDIRFCKGCLACQSTGSCVIRDDVFPILEAVKNADTLLFATPVATSSYPMAAAMGGDGPLAGELVVITNVFSLVTLFLFIFGFSAFGLL